MKLFIDCEWNDFGGDLISIALVSEDGKEFYEEFDFDESTSSEWVRDNVISKLGHDPQPRTVIQQRLGKYLHQFDSIEVVADWPEDIKHFCDLLITGPGMRLNTPPLMMIVTRLDGDSENPHHALYDARALKRAYLSRYK